MTASRLFVILERSEPTVDARGVSRGAKVKDLFPLALAFKRALRSNFLYPSPLRGAPLKQGSSSQRAVFVLGTHKGCPYGCGLRASLVAIRALGSPF